MRISEVLDDPASMERKFTIAVDSLKVRQIHSQVMKYLIEEITALLSKEMAKEIIAKVNKKELVREVTKKSIEDISTRLSRSIKIEGVSA